MGKEVAGISGAGIARVHERLQEEIRKDMNLREIIDPKLSTVLCQ